MTRPVLLLSDLHLPNTPSPLREGFLAFLAGPAREASDVYLLGDLFEYWIGDAEGLRDYGVEAAALKRLADSGVKVWSMHGNRDFMVGRDYARHAGFTLLPDPTTITLFGTPTLLAHGDVYCTEDVGYQRWRRFSRNPLAQAIYRRMPEAARLKVAGTARGDGAERRNKPESILDVNEHAIAAAIAKAGVPRMIHGHTHRPTTHRVTLADGRVAERLVLSDWRPGHYEYLRADDTGLHRCLVPAPQS